MYVDTYHVLRCYLPCARLSTFFGLQKYTGIMHEWVFILSWAPAFQTIHAVYSTISPVTALNEITKNVYFVSRSRCILHR